MTKHARKYFIWPPVIATVKKLKLLILYYGRKCLKLECNANVFFE